MKGNHRTAADPTAANAFGSALRRYRQRLAWSQEDLADASGVAARTISDLERGVARQPRSATVRLLAEALRLSGPDLAAFRAAARPAGQPTPPDRGQAPTAAPENTLRSLLAALGVGREQLPGRQASSPALVILGGAAALAELASLLPETADITVAADCVVIVTSRPAEPARAARPGRRPSPAPLPLAGLG
jgi:transcriptional regulator with XRE-family HTH domain